MNEYKLFGYSYYAGIMETEIYYFLKKLRKILLSRKINNIQNIDEGWIGYELESNLNIAVEYNIITNKEKECIIFFKEFIKSIKDIIANEENLKNKITELKSNPIQYSFEEIKNRISYFKGMMQRIRGN